MTAMRGGAGGDATTAVADSFACGELTDLQEDGRQASDGLYPRAPRSTHPIEADAEACHIKSVFGEALDTCRIQQVTLRLVAEGSRQGFGSGDEGLRLTLGKVTLVRLVGSSQMRED